MNLVPGTSPMRILIVEDSLVMRRLLRTCLQKWQYEVEEAEHGRKLGNFSSTTNTRWFSPTG